MGLLVRSWNVFHGNSVPPGRESRLAEAVRLATEDSPDVVCLQELPVWALGLLDDWSGMTAVGAVAARPSIGPFPSSAEVGRRLTAVHSGLLRSAFTGQANAILLRPDLRVLETHALPLNDWTFRRAQARWLGLPPLARLAWAKERRVCHAARIALPDGGTALVANLHATAYRPDPRLADAELLRAAAFADAVARPEEPLVLAGDFNVFRTRSRTLADLLGPEWGFAGGGGRSVDYVLARGFEVGRVQVWPEERRRRGGVLLSDHSPVEVQLA